MNFVTAHTYSVTISQNLSLWPPAPGEIPVKHSSNIFHKLYDLHETTMCFWSLKFWARREKELTKLYPKIHYWMIFNYVDTESIVGNVF